MGANVVTRDEQIQGVDVREEIFKGEDGTEMGMRRMVEKNAYI